MKHVRHYKNPSEAASREAAQIGTLIADLNRIVEIIDCDIVAEEERAGVSDQSNIPYSMLPSALIARRDNLRDTIAALRLRLETDLSNSVPPRRNGNSLRSSSISCAKADELA
jgi:hypothetical protein